MPSPFRPHKFGENPRDIRATLDVIELIELELEKIRIRLEKFPGQQDRIGLKAEQVHLQNLLRKLRRKPPESGLAVPAVPPNGPRPKQGGAEAPLDFGD